MHSLTFWLVYSLARWEFPQIPRTFGFASDLVISFFSSRKFLSRSFFYCWRQFRVAKELSKRLQSEWKNFSYMTASAWIQMVFDPSVRFLGGWNRTLVDIQWMSPISLLMYNYWNHTSEHSEQLFLGLILDRRHRIDLMVGRSQLNETIQQFDEKFTSNSSFIVTYCHNVYIS